MIISVQEQHLSGDTLIEKWAHAQRLGFDALELRGAGNGAFAARLPQLQEASASGVIMPTECVEMAHFIGDFDADKRQDAVDQLSQQLRAMSAIGGKIVVSPASYGMFSDRLPPFVAPRSPAEDRRVLLEGLSSLAAVAEETGTTLALEPLNRYENHMVRTLGDAVSLCEEIGSSHLGVCADTYHMNIEEADPLRSMLEAAAWISHVQLSDTNRLEPGAGHLDWGAHLAVLRSIGYRGPLAYESRLSGPADQVLPRSVRLVRQLGGA
ncbi:sugar phosphate isomerase/epimerase family protein [Propionibacteriaceae bacterium Y1685]